MLIDAGADINAQDDEKNSPMHFAAAGGHATTLKMLIDAGADINAQYYKKKTPMHTATFYRRAKALIVSLARGDMYGCHSF